MAENKTVPIMQDVDDPESLINNAFKRLSPPAGKFDINGSWKLVYDDLSTFSFRHFQGELSLQHTSDGKLRIENYRNTPDKYRTYNIAELQCSESDWRAPLSWNVESKVAKKPKDKAYLNSGISKKVDVKNGILTIKTMGNREEIRLPGKYNCKWALLNSIGRLKKLKIKNIEFTLIDEYDQTFPGQKISFSGKEKIKTKKGMIDIWCYQHIGTGTMPGVFYLDSYGRVLVYMAGMQMLILKEVDGVKTS